MTTDTNNPETAQVGATSKPRKKQKDLKLSSILSYSTRKPKSWTVGAPFLNFQTPILLQNIKLLNRKPLKKPLI